MRVGLCFDGFYSIQEMIELAQLADEIGMESIWMSDHLCFRDSLTTSMALLARTQKIKVAPAPMSPYSRNPIITAMSLATMDEFAPGRVIGSPGTGNAAALKEAGMESPHPLQTMREYVDILRRYLKGDTVDFHGKMFQINGAKMGFVPSTPIAMYITAVRSLMLQLAGEIAKGAAKAGRPAGTVDVAGFVTASVADDAREAIDANKMFLAYIFRNAHHAENVRLGGAQLDQPALAAAVSKRDWDVAKKFITDEMVFAHSVAGTPADCRKQLEAFTKGGLDLPIVLPMGTQDARKRVVRMVREIVG